MSQAAETTVNQSFELVCKASDPEWLRMRQTGIGASEAAALLGLSPWKSELQLYAEKVGALPPEDLSDSEVVFWGTRLESVVRDVYAERTKRHIDKGGVLLRSFEHPWALATLDAWTSDRELGPYWPLEIKTTGASRGGDWVDGPPELYSAQVHWQMLVTGAKRATIACLIGGQRLVWADVERDEQIIRRLVHAGQEFWARVERRDAPAPDGSEGARRALHDLYPQHSAKLIQLPAELADAFDAIEDAKAEAKRAEGIQRAAENVLKAALGDAHVGVLPDGREVHWSTEERKAYTVAAGTRRVLRLKQPRFKR